MKVVSILLLAVLATLAWANPSYFPDEDAYGNPGDDYLYYPSEDQSNEVSDKRSISSTAYELSTGDL